MSDEITPQRPEDKPPPQPRPARSSEFDNLGRDVRHYSEQTTGGGGGGGNNAVVGWIIFILIFGVGNLILYNTTGIFLIPIRR